MSNVMNTDRAHPHLDAAQIAQLRSRMKAQLDELVAQDATLRGRLADDESATSNTFVAGGEGAVAAESDEEVLALLHHEQAEIAGLAQALQRIETGHYGWCTACGEAIQPARLLAVPEAALCIDCQSDAEKHRRAV